MGKQKEESLTSFQQLRQLGVLLLVIFALRHTVASPYYVPTASMEPTIKVGDRLLAWKLAYDFKLPYTDINLATWGDPVKGDIIVFKYPRDLELDYVKRVVGVPGDRIEVRDALLYINGELQERRILESEADRSFLDDITDQPSGKDLYVEDLVGLDHYVMQKKGVMFRGGRAWTVPEDSYFVMGDNRDNSADSRLWGFVPREYVRGKAMFVMWSKYTKDEDPWYTIRMRLNRFGYSLYAAPEVDLPPS